MRNKKTIIIVAITLILAIVATVGTVMYLNDDGTAKAGFEGDNTNTVSPNGNNAQTNDNNQTNNVQEGNEGTSQEAPGELPQAGTDGNNNSTTRPSGSNGTTTSTSGNNTLPDEEYITERIEEVERQITEDLLVGWTPISIKSTYSTSGLGIYKPELSTTKVVVTENGKEYVVPGEILTYGVAVKNVGNDEIKGINISDIVPLQTTLIPETTYIYQNEEYKYDVGNYNEELNKISWKVNLSADETIVVGFAVLLNEDANGTIKNVAVVNGDETNEVENPVVIIEGHKAVDKATAWVGEELLYTITLENSGVVPGIVTVKDAIPEGTTYVVDSIDEKGVYNEETNTIEWKDIEVTPETPVELAFKVKIDLDRTTSVINTAILNDEQIPEQPETKVINIIGEKSSKHEEILTEEGKIDYTITLTNIGNETGKITVTDKIPEGTTYIVDSVDEKGVYNEETNTIEWKDIEVTPEIPVELKFSVMVNVFDQGEEEKEIVNQASIGNEVTDIAVKKMIDKTVNKQWKNDTMLLREDVQVELLANGQKTGNIITLTTRNMWQETFKDLPKYDEQGKEIVYTIEELTQIEGYTSTISDMTVTNSYEEPTLDITATKVWNGEIDSHIRPQEIEVQLYADNVAGEIKTVASNGTDTWTVDFTDLQKYRTGTRTLIVYTVKEVTELPEGYEKQESGMTVTNTYTEPLIDIPVTKTWVGDENVKAKVRPASIEVQLYADDVAITAANGGVKTITPDAQGNWATEYTSLPKYDYTDGTRKRITYTITENVPNMYEESIDANFNITNTYKPITFTKTSDATNDKIELGDIITYTITIRNTNNKNAVKVEFKDTIPVNTELNGNITVTPSTGSAYTISKTEMEAGKELTVPGNGNVQIVFKVKTLRTALGAEKISNTAYVNDEPTENILTTVEKGMKIYQVESSKEGQKAIIVLDMSLSMASAVNSSTMEKPENENRTDDWYSDYLAYSYETTRWYATITALNHFVDDFFASNSKNEIYIYGFNKTGIQTMSAFATNATEAKAAYNKVFTKVHYNNLVAAAACGENKYNSQIQADKFENKWDMTSNGQNYNIDVDALTFLSQGYWCNTSEKYGIKAGDPIPGATPLTDEDKCLLASYTNITAGLEGANQMIAQMKNNGAKLNNVNVILMSDGKHTNSLIASSTVSAEATKIKNEGIRLYAVAFTSDAQGLFTTVGEDNIYIYGKLDTTHADPTTGEAAELDRIFANMATEISEKGIKAKTTTSQYIDLSGVVIPEDTDVRKTIIKLFNVTTNATVEELALSDFRTKYVVGNNFKLTQFLINNSTKVDEQDEINLEIYTTIK